MPELSERLGDSYLRIFDCRFSLFDKKKGYIAYLNGHLPGAAYVNLDDDLAGPVTDRSGRHPIPNIRSFIEKLGVLGIGRDHHVVVYDQSATGQAARFWWLLRQLNHKNVSVLDGGIEAWQSMGGELIKERSEYEPTTYLSTQTSFAHVTTNNLIGALNSRERLLIDARESSRFHGDEEPIDSVAGHIPGAINRPHAHNQISGRFKSPKELKAEFEKLTFGHHPADVIHMCGSGVTACQNILAMDYCGMLGSSLYIGSWSEWITDPRRPISTEDQRDANRL